MTRVHHSQINVHSASSSVPRSTYPTNLHGRCGARRGDRRRNGDCDRQSSAPRRARRGRAHAALPARTSRRAPASAGARPAKASSPSGRARCPVSSCTTTATIELTAAIDPLGPLHPQFDAATHAGLLTFLDVAARQPRIPKRVKVQIAGPLTLGVAYVDAGHGRVDRVPARARASRAPGPERWRSSSSAKLPGGGARVLPRRARARVLARTRKARSSGRPRPTCLSTALAACGGMSGVHVCGQGDLRLALDAGPQVVHFDVGALDLDDASALSRFLDGGGWIAWGAIPTHRPVGEQRAAAVEGAARRVVRADPARAATRSGCAPRRWSRPRAGSPVTARVRPSTRCCSPVRSATACTTTRPRRSSPSARRFRAWPPARSSIARRRCRRTRRGSCAS